jgi:hypothetical protein
VNSTNPDQKEWSRFKAGYASSAVQRMQVEEAEWWKTFIQQVDEEIYGITHASLHIIIVYFSLLL